MYDAIIVLLESQLAQVRDIRKTLANTRNIDVQNIKIRNIDIRETHIVKALQEVKAAKGVDLYHYEDY
jgi:hypothetical protein